MWIKVTPRHGRPYFLIPDAGGATFDPPRRPRLRDSRFRCGCSSRSELILLSRKSAEAARRARRDARCRSTRPSPPRNSMPGSRATRSVALVLAGADRDRHREHELLRDDDEGPLRADALRAPARRRAAVLPQPDGASRARRRRMSRADPRPDGRVLQHAQRQAGEPRDARRRRADRIEPDAVHCAAVGAALGRLHVASATYRAAPHQPPRPVVVAAGCARGSSVSRRRRRTSCWPPSSSS